MRVVAALLLVAGCALTGEFDTQGGGSSSTGGGDTAGSTSGGQDTGSTGSVPVGCDETPLRVATFNIESVGTVGTDPYIGLVATLFRIDADVVCLQEVEDFESAQLAAAADEAGYEFVVEAERSPAIGGEIHNACVSKVPMELVNSYTARDLSNDNSANDVGRDILGVRVEPAPGCYAAVFTMHLKSGFDYEDLFRRQVEVERLAQAVELYEAQRPDEPVFIVGDVNESIDDEDVLGTDLNSVPGELPGSYELGNDISLPLVYHPFNRVTALGYELMSATWQGSTIDATWGEVTRLDYVWYRGAQFVASEVYNACRDDGEGGLAKRGMPLACYASVVASDHLPVVGDFTLR